MDSCHEYRSSCSQGFLPREAAPEQALDRELGGEVQEACLPRGLAIVAQELDQIRAETPRFRVEVEPGFEFFRALHTVGQLPAYVAKHHEERLDDRRPSLRRMRRKIGLVE